jgi:hypothetical protein
MSIVEVQQQENSGNGSNNACVLPQLRGFLFLIDFNDSEDRFFA